MPGTSAQINHLVMPRAWGFAVALAVAIATLTPVESDGIPLDGRHDTRLLWEHAIAAEGVYYAAYTSDHVDAVCVLATVRSSSAPADVDRIRRALVPGDWPHGVDITVRTPDQWTSSMRPVELHAREALVLYVGHQCQRGGPCRCFGDEVPANRPQSARGYIQGARGKAAI